MILSAIQYYPKFSTCRADIKDNIRRCFPLLDQAGNLGSQLIVLPELAFTGYSFMNVQEAYSVSEQFDGPTYQIMKRIAREKECYIAWGYVEEDSGSLYNSATLIDPSGAILTRYRKINLWGNDFLWAKPGDLPAPIAETDIGKVSLVVCRDLRDKIPGNIPRVAVKSPTLFSGERMDIVCACVNWGKGGFPSTSWMDFAANNQCTLIVANRWGKEENKSFSQDFGQGGSIIIDKSWNTHTGGLVFGSNCVVTAAI